jgi:Na+-translocating ferredoxin:NAD+ oxidoreductase subunit A
MSFITIFLIAALSALTVENIIFTKAIGIDELIRQNNKSDLISMPNLYLIFSCTFASLVCFVTDKKLSNIIESNRALNYIRPLVFIAVIAIIYIVICRVLLRRRPKLLNYYIMQLSFATFNSAVLGTVLLNSFLLNSFTDSLGFGFGTGISLAISGYIVSEGSKRLSLSNIPKAFKGTPILLIYIAIISLAIWGIAGTTSSI